MTELVKAKLQRRTNYFATTGLQKTRLPSFEPEFKKFPMLMSQERIEERKYMIAEFTKSVLQSEKLEFEKQGDTYFTDKIKNELQGWGAFTYDLIYMNKHSRLQRQIADISYMKRLEGKVKGIQDTLKQFSIRKELEKATSQLRSRVSMKNVV